VNEISGLPEHFDVSYHELAGRHDIRLLVVRTLLTYLELAGFLEAGTPTYASYRFRPLRTSLEILSRFQGERREFLSALFRQAKKARVWFDIDLESACRTLESPRARIVGALDYLAEQQLLELRAGGLRYRYRWLRQIEDHEEVARELQGKMLLHEEREIERLDMVMEWAACDGCQTGFLSRVFGEILEAACGHCGWCLEDRQPARLLAVDEPTIDEELWREAESLRSEVPETLGEERAFSRFLIGLTSPRLTRTKLTRHALFGALSQVPFFQVLERAKSG